MTIRGYPAANDEAARNRLRELMRDTTQDYTGVSTRVLGRSAGYLGRYVRDSVPERLTDEDVGHLARYFRVEPCELSAAWRDA